MSYAFGFPFLHSPVNFIQRNCSEISLRGRRTHSIHCTDLFLHSKYYRNSIPLKTSLSPGLISLAFDHSFLSQVKSFWLQLTCQLRCSASMARSRHIYLPEYINPPNWQASAEASSWDVYTLTDSPRNTWVQQNYLHSHLENGWAGFTKISENIYTITNAENSFTVTSRLSKIQNLIFSCL